LTTSSPFFSWITFRIASTPACSTAMPFSCAAISTAYAVSATCATQQQQHLVEGLGDHNVEGRRDEFNGDGNVRSACGLSRAQRLLHCVDAVVAEARHLRFRVKQQRERERERVIYRYRHKLTHMRRSRAQARAQEIGREKETYISHTHTYTHTKREKY
jgi:hypothetical protein